MTQGSFDELNSRESKTLRRMAESCSAVSGNEQSKEWVATEAENRKGKDDIVEY